MAYDTFNKTYSKNIPSGFSVVRNLCCFSVRVGPSLVPLQGHGLPTLCYSIKHEQLKLNFTQSKSVPKVITLSLSQLQMLCSDSWIKTDYKQTVSASVSKYVSVWLKPRSSCLFCSHLLKLGTHHRVHTTEYRVPTVNTVNLAKSRDVLRHDHVCYASAFSQRAF